MAAGWVLPTSHIDGDGLWNNESRAYDNLTTNPWYAGHATHPAGSWTGFLTLNIAAIYCSKVRYWQGGWLTTKVANIDLDVYWDGSWHNIYQGVGSRTGSPYAYHELSLGGTYQVTKMRIRMQNTDNVGRPTFIWEAQFYQVDGPILQSEDINVVSSVSGSLTVIPGSNIYGTTDAVSSASGSLKVETALVGSVNASSSGSGRLTYQRLRLLADPIIASSNVSGSLDAQPGLVGSVNTSSDLIACLCVRTTLSGTANAISFASAVRLNTVILKGSLTGVTSPSGDASGFLSVITSLEGVSSPSANLSGFMNLELGFAGVSNQSADNSASLSVLTTLAGLTAGVADVSAVRLNTVILKGSLTGLTAPEGAASGSLSVLTTLTGTISASSVASASLDLIILGFYERLNNDLAGHFQELANIHGWTVRFDNDPRSTPTSGLWFQFTLNFGDPRNKHFGKTNSYRHPMQLIIIVKNTMGCGMGNILDAVDLVATAYRRTLIASSMPNDYGNIVMRTPRIVKVGRVEDNYQINVICPFYIDN